MSKSFKKVMSLLVIFVFIAVSVIGCSKPSQGTSSSSSSSESSSVSESASATPTPTEVPKPTVPDLQGRTIKVVAWWDETPTGGTEVGDLMVKRRADIEKKYNCKFEFITMGSGDIPTKFAAAAMAGTSIGDIIFMRHAWAFPSFAAKGYLAPLDDIIDFSQPIYNQDVKNLSNYNGKTYAFSTYKNGVASSIIFNKNIFERYGIENPYDLVKNNQWTWDKFEEISKKLTQDTNGDGKTDLWATGAFSEYPFVFANDGAFNKMINGKMTSTLTEENTIQALDFIHKLYSVDKVAEMAPQGSDWDYNIKQFQSGKYAMLVCGYWVCTDLKKNMTDKFGFLPMPMGPKATGYSNVNEEISIRVIPAAVKDAKEVAMVYNDYQQPLTDNQDELDRADVEANTCDPESVDIYFQLVKSEQYCDHDAYEGYWENVVPAFNQVAKGEKTAKAAMDAVNGVWQAAIDKASAQ